MPNRRKGAAGSFGAPLETIVASFPAESGNAIWQRSDQPAQAQPRLSLDDVGASIRAAFALIDRQEPAES